ncbi:MAG: prolipoprotein diacylglyceryl transferase [Acidimicrobiaceae bacterium]|nr:prolipoprotein diacylglyceryl transferase [Acidimicrobiaceae bacterium]
MHISGLEMLAAIPSPGTSGITLGPLQLHAYGLMIALGVLAAVVLSKRRWAAYGADPDQITHVALWSVPAGLIGARAYHVFTDWKQYHYEDGWLEAFAVWKGGLGIPGGLAAGIVTAFWVMKRLKMDKAAAVDAIAPSLPLAQAIGRFGNWFNQELFGLPTTLPWGLRIDERFRPELYADSETFHPTFLYEAIWNVFLCLLLILIDRRKMLRPGSILVAYIGGYGIGRLWIEAIRIDHASLLFGVRINIYMSAILIIGSLLYLLKTRAWSYSKTAAPNTETVDTDTDKK